MQPTLEQQQAKTEKFAQELDALRLLHAKIQKQVSRKFAQWKKNQDQLIEMQISSSDNFAETAKLMLTTLETDEHYQRRNEFLSELGLQSSGYFFDTQQACIQLRVTPDEDLTLKTAGLKQILPIIEPIDIDGEKQRVLSVFEHTLSEFGAYEVHVNNQDEFALVVIEHSRQREVFRTKNLIELLEYVQKNHWYD